jgi:hypothetical protein
MTLKETTFFRLSDGALLGTETQRRRQANMARLIGTGKDPLGRYGEDEVFDVPENDPLYDELIEKGYAKALDPEDDPGRIHGQIAEAVVAQGGSHQLADPVDQKIAEEVEDRALDIVHTEDPNAQAGDAGLDPGDRPQDKRQVSPAQVSARSIASADPEKSARLQEVADAEAGVETPSSEPEAPAEPSVEFTSDSAAELAQQLTVAEHAELSPGDGSGADGKFKIDDIQAIIDAREEEPATSG